MQKPWRNTKGRPSRIVLLFYVIGCADELQTSQHTSGRFIAPFLLDVILASTDDLIILTVTCASKRRTKVPGALVAVFVAATVIPGIAVHVGDRLVMFVADHVDLRIGVIVIWMLPAITGRGNGIRVRHVGV